MMEAIRRLVLPLFVPGDRPDRFAKAAGAGADGIIVDLEDSVAASAKDMARAHLAENLSGIPIPIYVRVNAVGTPWHEKDVAICGTLPIAGIVLPKAETARACERVRKTAGKPVIALVETAMGLDKAREIASSSVRLAFGSVDFVADLGMSHTREALLHARATLVLASRLAGQPAPIDGVTTAIADEALIEDDCRYAAALGLGGKLLIHPAQIRAARRGFAPSDREAEWADRVLAAARTGAVSVVDGQLVDGPVVARARLILVRAKGLLTEDPALDR